MPQKNTFPEPVTSTDTRALDPGVELRSDDAAVHQLGRPVYDGIVKGGEGELPNVHTADEGATTTPGVASR